MVGIFALIHAAGVSRNCAWRALCLASPRPQLVLDLHDLRDWEGGLLLSSKLDFPSATKMLRWGSLRTSSQLKVRPCHHMHMNLRVAVGITFKNKDFNNVHCHYCTY